RSSRSASRHGAAADVSRTSESFEAAAPPMATPAPTGIPDPMPTTGAFTIGTYESVRGTGPFEAAPGASTPGFPTPGAPEAASASTDAWAEAPRNDAYDLAGSATGPFSPADT